MKYTDTIADLTKSIKEVVQSLYGLPKLFIVSVTVPTDRTKADLVSNVAFTIAKEKQMSPVEISASITAELHKIANVNEYFAVSSMAPGFINFKVTDKFLTLVLQDVLTNGADFGKNSQYLGQTWVVEHTSPNPNKAMHIGHLRNNLIGMSLAHCLENSGAKVVYDMIDNDRGIAIAKAMWGFLKSKQRNKLVAKDTAYWFEHQTEWLNPIETGIKPDHFVGDCYQIGADAYKIDEVAAKEINQMVVDWENEDPKTWALWKLIIDYAHEGIELTLKTLGNRWDNQWHEHDHYKQGKALVDKGLELGIFKRLPDNAVLSDLKDYKLPDTILLKSTGTALYITQDIALTKLKREKFHADKLIWVIGPEQNTAMKQVFAICEQLGIGKLADYIHIAYGLVKVADASGKSKKMSSRGGEALYIDELIKTVTEQLTATDRGYTPEIAQDIAVSAIKYAILKIGRNSDVTIDLDNVISLEGDSGVYILYTYGRMNSLLQKKSTLELVNPEFSETEHDLIMQLLYYPLWVESAAKDYAPNLIAGALLKFAQTFNAYYAQERIITDNEVETAKKLSLTKALSLVYKNGLELLGMSPLTKI